jgi:uncharacterized protein YjgD (DUF1641 family)
MTTTLAPSVEQRLDEMADQIRFLSEEAKERQNLRDSITELTNDLTPIARQGMDSVTQALLEAEARGYIDFARSGLGIVDRVVTSYSEDDVEALGDNIVLILDTIKEMTQPEVMQMMQSTFHNMADVQGEIEDPPGLFALLGQMRDSEVRRGLGRMMAVLRSMGQISEKTNGKEAQQ